MRVALNAGDEVEIAELDDDSTVQDFFDAMATFSRQHPLPCDTCDKNCCDGRFNIEMDSVSATRLAHGNLRAYIDSALQVTYPDDQAIQLLLSKQHQRCRYLTADRQCGHYSDRPASCRAFTCMPRSPRYDVIDRTIVSALHYALVAQYFELLMERDESGDLGDALSEPLAWLRDSPAYGKSCYESILIKECVRFDAHGLDAESDEMATYREILSMGDVT